jgi:hypothetical protein
LRAFPPRHVGSLRQIGGEIIRKRGKFSRPFFEGWSAAFWDRYVVFYRREGRRLLWLVVDKLFFVSLMRMLTCRHRWDRFCRSSRRLAFAKDGLLGLFLGPFHAWIY